MMDRQEIRLLSRMLGLIRHNPKLLITLIRMAYRQNLGIDLDRRRHPGRSGPPVTLKLNLTRRCNLRCLMCIQYHQPSQAPQELSWYDPQRELPLSTWTSLLDQVLSYRPSLYLTGGEPMMYPHFEEFFLAAKSRGFLVHLQTNGTMLAPKAELLVTQGLDWITVSLDGPEEVHDRIRGQKGVFRRTTDGIKALMQTRQRLNHPGPILVLNCVISKDNYELLDHLVPLALDLQADILQVQHTIFDWPDNVERHNLLAAKKLPQTLGLEEIAAITAGEFYQSKIEVKDLPVLLAKVEKVRRQAEGKIKIQFIPKLTETAFEPYYLRPRHPFKPDCNSLWKESRILPDGTVSPCLNIKIGNIAQQPFAAIWNGPPMQRLREIIAGRLLPGCLRCCRRSY
jgi:Fe-coproporphyrin III synthase